MWRYPVGDGAKRTRGPPIEDTQGFYFKSGFCRGPEGRKWRSGKVPLLQFSTFFKDGRSRAAAFVLQYGGMGHTITVRLTQELAAWLEEAAARTGVSQGRIIRDQLEQAKSGGTVRSFMRLAGSVKGRRDLSSRKGFSRS